MSGKQATVAIEGVPGVRGLNDAKLLPSLGSWSPPLTSAKINLIEPLSTWLHACPRDLVVSCLFSFFFLFPPWEVAVWERKKLSCSFYALACLRVRKRCLMTKVQFVLGEPAACCRESSQLLLSEYLQARDWIRWWISQPISHSQ